jgi:hypothetical protein
MATMPGVYDNLGLDALGGGALGVAACAGVACARVRRAGGVSQGGAWHQLRQAWASLLRW